MADTSRARPRAHKNDIEAARERRRERLARSVDLLRLSESFRGWLRAMKRLHRYSPQNVRLIVSQCPEATFVASYRRWQRELGYQVRKGERGIMVFAPRLVRRDRGEPAEAPGESQEQRLVFRAVHVFDRSQVEPIPGRALPLEAPECAPVEGDTHARLIPRLEALATELGFTVERRALEEGVGGRCDSKANLITVAAGQSPNAEVRVLAHELAHALGVGYRSHGRERAECIVECAAYLALAAAGLDVSASSVPYLAGWAGEDPEVLERDAAEIDRIARRLEQALGGASAAVAEAA